MKNSVTKLLSLIFAAALLVVVTACGDDDPLPDAPSVTAPSQGDVDEGTTVTLTFSVASLGGYTSAALSGQTGGTASITSEPADAATAGTVEVSFVAQGVDLGQTVPGSVTLTVTDANGNTGAATVVFSVVSTDIADTFTTADITEMRTVGGSEVEFKQTRITGVINRDFTFTNDVAWVLNGRVVVGAGATLTIEEGTIVKGENGQGALASVLIVARDGNIDANGTAANPIVFTSFLDNINVGEFNSTLDIDQDLGLWGGVLILGNAPIFAGAAQEQIEGIPTSDTNGLYGGSDAADDSGSFEYASIRFTGIALGPGNELQGLTLGGVGSGTTIANVESINSADDGIEIFGGTVNISNFLVMNPDDDGFDTDQGWSGTVTNHIYIGQTESAGFDSDHPYELDGPEGDTGGTPQVGKFRNGTAWGRSASDFADIRDGGEYDLQDIYFFGFEAGVDLEIDADDNNDDPRGSDNYANNVTVLSGLEFRDTDRDGAVSFTDETDLLDDKLDGSTQDPNKSAQVTNNETVKFPGDNAIVTNANKTKGATVADFAWTYANVVLDIVNNANF